VAKQGDGSRSGAGDVANTVGPTTFLSCARAVQAKGKEARRSALRVGDSGLVYARNDPMLDPLRKDPRFVQLPKHIGFD
jgi:hypothetical protein